MLHSSACADRKLRLFARSLRRWEHATFRGVIRGAAPDGLSRTPSTTKGGTSRGALRSSHVNPRPIFWNVLLVVCCGPSLALAQATLSAPASKPRSPVFDLNADGLADFVVPGPLLRTSGKELTSIEIRSARTRAALSTIAMNTKGS